MLFAEIGGVVLHYRVNGAAGAPVVALANSLGTDARIWDGVIARLAETYRVISYDKRGHGLSDAPAGEYRLEQHIDDLSGLLHHLGVDELALGGVSVGGLIAQGFALKHPGRLKALVLCDTAPKVGDVAFWAARMDKVLSEGLGAIADGIMERWFSPGFRENDRVALAGWRNMFLRADPKGYAATCATLRDSDLRSDIGRISVPTLVVAGEDDLATPPDLVRSTAEAIPGARFVSLPGVGHIPSIERPAELATLMADFFKEAGHG